MGRTYGGTLPEVLEIDNVGSDRRLATSGEGKERKNYTIPKVYDDASALPFKTSPGQYSINSKSQPFSISAPSSHLRFIKLPCPQLDGRWTIVRCRIHRIAPRAGKRPPKHPFLGGVHPFIVKLKELDADLDGHNSSHFELSNCMVLVKLNVHHLPALILFLPLGKPCLRPALTSPSSASLSSPWPASAINLDKGILGPLPASPTSPSITSSTSVVC